MKKTLQKKTIKKSFVFDQFKVNENTKFIYVYLDSCRPCIYIKPTIDAFITFGYPIQKIPLDSAKNLFDIQFEKRGGVPCLLKYKHEEPRKSTLLVGAEIFLALENLYANRNAIDLCKYSSIAESIKYLLDKELDLEKES